jgi:aquaporin Z
VMFVALKAHWPEYLMEAAGLGIFMISACVVDALLEYPLSQVHQTIRDPIVRTILRGLARGLTAVGLIYAPWGKQSGAHFNPAITLTFWWLGKVRAWDGCLLLHRGAVPRWSGGGLADGGTARPVSSGPPVEYAVTVPGAAGQAIAFLAELLISFGLVLEVLIVSNTRRVARFTSLCAAALMALCLMVERPYSGMSMNPAHTLASAAPAMIWTGLRLYFAAPLLSMVLAGQVYLLSFGRMYCAKLHHDNDKRCIFHHGYDQGAANHRFPVLANLARESARTDIRSLWDGGGSDRETTGRPMRSWIAFQWTTLLYDLHKTAPPSSTPPSMSARWRISA